MPRFLACGLCCLLLVTPASPRDGRPWVGDTFIVKHAGVRFGRIDPETGAVVPTGSLNLMYYRVEAETLRLARVREYGADVWVDKADGVLVDDAVAFFTDRIRRAPTSTAYCQRAAAWQLRGDLDAAIADYDHALVLNPREYIALNNRGYAWLEKGKYAEAVADFTDALRLRPGLAAPLVNRGNARRAMKDYDRAIEDYTAAVRSEPTADALNNRGLAWAAKKEFDKAVADYSVAILLDPRVGGLFANRANAWRDKGAYDKAAAGYATAARLGPDDFNLHNSLAWFLATCPDRPHRDGARAVAAATRACELTDWKDPNCLATLAVASAEAGRFDEAVMYQRKALESPEYAKRYAEKARGRLSEYEGRSRTPGKPGG